MIFKNTIRCFTPCGVSLILLIFALCGHYAYWALGTSHWDLKMSRGVEVLKTRTLVY